MNLDAPLKNYDPKAKTKIHGCLNLTLSKNRYSAKKTVMNCELFTKTVLEGGMIHTVGQSTSNRWKKLYKPLYIVLLFLNNHNMLINRRSPLRRKEAGFLFYIASTVYSPGWSNLWMAAARFSKR